MKIIVCKLYGVENKILINTDNIVDIEPDLNVDNKCIINTVNGYIIVNESITTIGSKIKGMM